AELADLDGVIDKGEGSDADGHQRREVVRLIQKVEKRGRLTIRGVLVDGIWMESPHLVKHEFFEHFKNRFEKPNKSRILLERDFVKKISLEDNDDLERDVSNEEIKRAVWDCGIDKAPGPDGLTFGFYRRYWDIIGNDVPNANMVKDFKPISLIGSLYKVIAKVMANRLVTVLDDIVDEIQSTFVTDRQILDSPFILNEIVHWCKNKKKQSMIFKVDFEKWDFIDDILRWFGFGEKWYKWIQSCLYSSRGSVLVNESPTKEFQFHKGLKQGDPLSPFLFILVMESLHISFQRVVDASLFNRIKLDSSLQISHLFYADDAIFMGQWSQCNIDTIIRVLDVFYRASGLMINMNKSNLRVITPPTTKTDTTVIPTETPIIAPTIPPSHDYTPASPDYSPTFDIESDPSLDHIPPLPAVLPFLSSDDDTTDSDTPDTPPSPTHDTPFTEITASTQRSLSYLVYFLGPSRKRRRFPMTSVPALPLVSGALSPIRVDLIPSPKRVRDIGYLEDVEVGPRETRVKRVTHLAMPKDIPKPTQEGAVQVTYETLGDLV
nr:RNA-directed DNA polymerase, eukaryota [Tanacetum cinerariifolium]